MPASLIRIIKHPVTAILLGGYIFYLALSMLVISPWINWQVGRYYKEYTGRDLHFDTIHFNPFALSLTLQNASDKNVGGSILWSVTRVYVNCSLLESLAQQTIVVDEIRIDQPQAYPQRLTSSQWNFDDILHHQSVAIEGQQQNNSTESTTLPAISIRNIQITEGNFEISDKSLKKPVVVAINNLFFEMEGFSTVSDDAQAYSLKATIINADKEKTPGELEWQGKLSLKNADNKGSLTVKNILLSPFWMYTKPHFNFTLHSTTANITGDYHINWKNAFEWSLQDGQLSLEKISLTSGKKATRNAELTTDHLLLDKIAISSTQKSIKIAEVELEGVHLKSWSEGAESGFIKAFMPDSSNEESEPSPWTVNIESLAVNKSAVDWRVADLAQHNFQLRNLNLKAQPVDLNGNTPSAITFKSTIDKDSKVFATGDINLSTLDGAIAFELQNFPLAITKPLLTPYININDLSGTLDTHGDVEIRNATPTQIHSQGKLNNVKLNSGATTQEILTWEHLGWEKTHLDINQQKIDIPLVSIRGLNTRSIIFKEGTTNLQDLIPQAPEGVSQTETKSWQFNLHKLVLDNASFRFHDESLTPNFVAAVQHFNGSMTNLSSDIHQAAHFLFTGDVDNYAPVKLQGKTQPFLDQPLLDAQLDFENLDLGGFSGYSSTYAGWRIERGLLTANLHYRLNDGLIEGDNHIEMDQLQLGERVHNATAKDIPLRLALALITDENGIATLDISVSGKTDDPSFNVGKVIRAAVRNTFKKIIKAPFKLLGKLVGTKEDLGELPFNSGSSKLLATATRKLNALQEAMNKRPELRIELRGSYDPVTDTRGLQTAQIAQLLLANNLTNQDLKNKNQRWQTAVTREYKKLDINDGKTPNTNQMYDQLLQSVVITQEELDQLATTRSTNAKQFLVQHLKIDNNRVLVNSSTTCEKQNVCNRRLVKIDLSDISQISVNNTSLTQTSSPAEATHSN